MYYRLDENSNPAPATPTQSLMGRPSVGRDELPNGYRVSTVFLGMAHCYEDDKPIVFETMVFAAGSWTDLDVDRYATWAEAEAGHKAMVEKWAAKEAGECHDDSE